MKIRKQVKVVFVELGKKQIIIRLRWYVKEIIKLNIIDYFLINKRKRSRN
jgi:hypothetical protein